MPLSATTQPLDVILGSYQQVSPNKKCTTPYTYSAQVSTVIGSLNATILQELTDKSEIKSQLQTRLAAQTDATKNQLILTGDANQLVHLCFLPSSKTFLAQGNGIADGTAGTTRVCPMMNLFWFVIGITAGSVANAIIYRLPRGIVWHKGRSICPNCKHNLSFLDLIPVLSFLYS